MGDDLNILLSAQIDMNKSITNINDSIKTLQSKLKDINISFNIKGLDKSFNESIKNVERSMQSVTNVKMSTDTQREYYSQVMEYVHKYKLELISTSEYIEKLNKSIYSNDGRYSGSFNNDLGKKEQEFIVKELNNALKEQDKILQDIDKTYDAIEIDDKKRIKSLNDQSIAIDKMQSAFNNQNNKYSSSIDNDKSGFIQSQINALAKLNPQTIEYQNALKGLQFAVGAYNKELANSATLEDKQTKALVDKSIAIDKIKDKLTTMKSNYGASVDTFKSKGINDTISDLQKLDPLSVEYRNNLKKIQYETDKLGNESRQSFKKAQDAISDTTAKSTDLGLAIRTLGQMFMIGSPIYLAQQVFRDMASSINEMNKATTDIRLVTGMSEDSVNGLKESYNQLGKEMGATTNEVLASSTEWFRQGKTIAETEELVKASMIGSKLGAVESAQMTEYLTSSLNGYKLEAKDAISVVDKLVSVDIKAATSTAELAQAMSRTASSARMAGVDMDTLVGYIGTVSSVTRKSAETIGESFKTMFARYQNIKLGKFVEDGTMESDVIKAMDNIGISIKDGEDSLISYGYAMDKLYKKWGTMSDAEKSSVANAMAGVRQRDNFIVLMDNYSQSMELAKTSAESAGTSIERFGIWSEGTESKLNKLKASIEGVFIKTLNSNTVNLLISLATESMNFVENLGGLVPILTTILGLVIAIKSANISSWMMSMVTTIGATAKAMVGVQVATQGATVAATGLQAAFGWIGIATIALSGLYMGMKSVSDSTAQAEEKVAELGDELSKLNSNKQTVVDLSVQYEELNKLSKAQNLNNEEQQKFYDIQNQLKSLLPTVNGYYDEHGNFILDASENMQTLIDKQQESIDSMRQLYAESSKVVINSKYDEFEKNKKSYEDAKAELEKFKAYKDSIESGGILDIEIEKELDFYKNGLDGAISFYDGLMEGSANSSANASKELKQNFMNILYNEDAWKKLEKDSKHAKDAISSVISSMDENEFSSYFNAIDEGTITYDEFIDTILKSPEAIEYMNQSLEKTNKTINDSTDATESQVSAFENLKKEFDSITSDVDMLNTTLKSLNENHSLSAKEISSLVEKYPQLLKHLNDEESLRLGLQEEITNTAQAQEKAYSDMLMSSEGYYNSLIAQDTDSRNELLWILDTYNNTVDSEHAKQLEDFQNLESLKIEATAKIISELGKLWQQYFSTLSKSFSQQGFDGGANIKYDMTKDQFDAMSNLKKSEYQKAIDNAKNSPIAKEYEAMYKKFEEASNTFANFTPTYNSSNSNKLGNSSGSKGSSSGGSNSAEKQIKEQFDAKIKAILAGTNELERTIALTQQQLEMAELKGEEDKAVKLKQQLIDQQKEKRDILHKQANELRALLSQTNDPEIKAGINDEIIKLQDDFHASKMQSYEDEIALIQRRNDLEKQAYDDRIKQIEIEQMLIKEDSDGYKALEEEKLSLLMGLQQGYQDKIKSLKAQGLTNEHEFVREYINLWQDAEVERLNMIKARADKEREVQLKALDEESKKYESQKKAMNDLLKLTIDMIKKEYEAKKNAIQDEIKLKEDSVKAELDGYKRIIDAKKESLQDAKDERSYQKGLDGKNKNIKDTEDKLLALSGDNSLKAQAEKKKLEAELQKYREELADYQYDKNIEQQMGALDDEYKLYEESKNKELDAYKEQKEMELKLLEEQTAKEGNIRKEAMDRLQKDGKSTYEQLLKYSSEYTDISQKEFDEMWGAANEAINAYSDSSMSLIDIMSALADEMKRIADESQRIKNQSWTDFVDDKEDLNSGGNTNKPSDKPNGGKPNNKPDSGLSQKGKEQLNQQKYLHDQMIVANETKNENLKKWIEKERVKWGIDPKTGAIVKQFHKGLDYGQVGTGLKANELILKATSDEWVFTNKQMSNLTSNINGMINTKQPNSITIQVDKFMDVANIDKGVDICYLVSKATDAMYKSLNATFKLNGFQPIR